MAVNTLRVTFAFVLDQLKVRLGVQRELGANRPRALEYLGIFDGGFVTHGIGRGAGVVLPPFILPRRDQ